MTTAKWKLLAALGCLAVAAVALSIGTSTPLAKAGIPARLNVPDEVIHRAGPNASGPGVLRVADRWYGPYGGYGAPGPGYGYTGYGYERPVGSYYQCYTDEGQGRYYPCDYD
jgi:hypothetical protein